MSFPLFRNVRRSLRWRQQFKEALPELDQNIHLLHGKTPPLLAPDEMMVTLLVQNGEHQIESFIEHHLALGARHIVVLDNTSTDRTVELSSRYDEVSVFSATLPYSPWQQRIKAWPGFHFSGEGWSLLCDIDERFDYPGSDPFSLPSFLQYLNQNNYSVVQSHMLDLFSLEPASLWPESGAELEEKCIWYDLEDVQWKPCRRAVHEAFGGIRKTAFGISPKLTKYPLLRWSAGARPGLKTSHAYATGRPADLTTLLRHYKFDRGFLNQCAHAVKHEHYWNNSMEYKSYLQTMENSPEFTFNPQNPKPGEGIEQLIEDGFINSSENYQQHVSSKKK